MFPVLTLQLVQRRCLEAFRVARPDRARAAVRRPDAAAREGGRATEDIVVVVTHARRRGEAVDRRYGKLAIDAEDPRPRARFRATIAGCREARHLAFRAERRAYAIAEIGDALILQPIVAAASLEDLPRYAGRVEVVPVDVGVGIAEPIAQVPVEQSRVEPRVADPLLGVAIRRSVPEREGGWGEAVDIVATVGVEAPQIDRDAVRHVDPERGVRAIVPEAVPLPARRERGYAASPVIAAADARRDGSELTGDIGEPLSGVVPATFGARVDCQPLGRLAGNQVHNAADRLAAPQHGLRAAQHLYMRDVTDQEVAEVEPAAGRRRIVDLDAVDQRHGLVALGAAYADGRYGARSAVADDGDAWGLAKEVGDDLRLATLDRLGIEHAYRLAHGRGGPRVAVAGHDDLGLGVSRLFETDGGLCALRECRSGRGQARQQQ